MHNNSAVTQSTKDAEDPLTTAPPQLEARRIGLVSRDYNHEYGNGYKDFSHSAAPVLQFLDDCGCDLVLFSLYSFMPRDGFDAFADPNLPLRNVRAICFEEFKIDAVGKRQHEAYVVATNSAVGWTQHRVWQALGTLASKAESEVHRFVQEEFVQRRIMGNCCLVICGESNAVKYSPLENRVVDRFGLRQTIPGEVTVVLNPVHDRMTRFEMMYKRRFLSEHSRWVVSVWNKGKINCRGQTRDGQKPAWTVFHNGEPVAIPAIPNTWGVEIGIVEVSDRRTTSASASE